MSSNFLIIFHLWSLYEFKIQQKEQVINRLDYNQTNEYFWTEFLKVFYLYLSILVWTISCD